MTDQDQGVNHQNGAVVHTCGHSWNHRWQWMRWFCNWCKNGSYITVAEHQRTGEFGAGPACAVCWPVTR